MTTTTTSKLNGLDPAALHGLIDAVAADAEQGQTHWSVTTRWIDGGVAQTQVSHFAIAGQRVDKDFTIRHDEPFELGGTNTAPNPQEYLLAALNACMTVGYVALATLKGIRIESLEIETEGDIDLRGFLGLDPAVKPGYEQIRYTVRIKGDATPEQFQEIHELVKQTSPNYYNIANAIALKAELVVE
ncbi:MAG: OsmC family protein [Phycisphaeraceae bacterium]|nr:OsmC family protein [Phycisphaeraceae bacterium]